MLRPTLFSLLCLYSCLAQAESFDWELLKGNWAESDENLYACRPDNVHQTLLVSADHTTLKLINDRPWLMMSGDKIKEYSATILKAEGKSLFIRYNSEIQNVPPEYMEWELRFIGPGTYRWRALSWDADVFNNVIGIKCAEEATLPTASF